MCSGAEPKTSACRGRAALKVFLDIAKGYVAVALCGMMGADCAVIAAFGVFIGHNYPFWNIRQGGTGLATVLGATIGLDPILGLHCLAAWMAGFYVYQNATAAALIAAIITPISASFLDLPFPAVMLVPVSAMVFARHYHRILLLLANGTLDSDDTEPLEPLTSAPSSRSV